MDQKLCQMIVEYWKKLQKDGVTVFYVTDTDIIGVPDSKDDKHYVDLETIGGGFCSV